MKLKFSKKNVLVFNLTWTLTDPPSSRSPSRRPRSPPWTSPGRRACRNPSPPSKCPAWSRAWRTTVRWRTWARASSAGSSAGRRSDDRRRRNADGVVDANGRRRPSSPAAYSSRRPSSSSTGACTRLSAARVGPCCCWESGARVRRMLPGRWPKLAPTRLSMQPTDGWGGGERQSDTPFAPFCVGKVLCNFLRWCWIYGSVTLLKNKMSINLLSYW